MSLERKDNSIFCGEGCVILTKRDDLLLQMKNREGRAKLKIKLIASDLDGTLLTDKKEILESTRESLARAAEQGICFVPSTGRAFASIPKDVLELPGVEYVITSNGAAVYDVKTGKRIYERLLEADAVERILELPVKVAEETFQADRKSLSEGIGQAGGEGLAIGAGRADREEVADGTGRAGGEGLAIGTTVVEEKSLVYDMVPIAFEAFIGGIPYASAEYVENPFLYGTNEHGAKYVQNTRRPVKNMRTFIYDHREQLDSIDIVCGNQKKKEEIRSWLLEHVDGIFVTASVPQLLEIGHQDAGKGKTLGYLMELLGVSPEEAMCFGDADNDIDMLQAVRYGIAMENATESCKRAAYAVTGSNQEDGVGQMIRKII